MKKFLTTFAVLAVIATPAFAQSFDPDNGTGNVLMQSVPHGGKTAFRQDALRAFAAAPVGGLIGNSNDPAATGGGSAGYNEMLRNY
jgi:hypothetical protein